MGQALKLVYRFIRDLDLGDQLFGLFGAWLAFVEPRDVRAFKLALEASSDRVLDPPARMPAIRLTHHGVFPRVLAALLLVWGLGQVQPRLSANGAHQKQNGRLALRKLRPEGIASA